MVINMSWKLKHKPTGLFFTKTYDTVNYWGTPCKSNLTDHKGHIFKEQSDAWKILQQEGIYSHKMRPKKTCKRLIKQKWLKYNPKHWMVVKL